MGKVHSYLKLNNPVAYELLCGMDGNKKLVLLRKVEPQACQVFRLSAHEGHSFSHLAANLCIYGAEESSEVMSPVLHSGVEQMQ